MSIAPLMQKKKHIALGVVLIGLLAGAFTESASVQKRSIDLSPTVAPVAIQTATPSASFTATPSVKVASPTAVLKQNYAKLTVTPTTTKIK